MDFFFAKLFEEYKKKKEPAELNITLYISFFYFLLLFSIYLPVSEVVNKLCFNNSLAYDKSVLTITIFCILGLLIYIVYKKYIRNKHIYDLVKKYKGKRINKFILYSLIVLLPLIIFLIGPTVTVLLKGGKFLGCEFNGLL
ncbi:hypothetical protein AHMF7605_23040 [Adhaeribacter arboris]|uniref:Uncharacterized protein n=1 Tax=Adhaeribacter arboris TaxID=2072846 RepID=A0A2T2YKY3_9BACT|nr:hypothetical protein AHMF7605_23040 [Adhaeribacter arboris]